MAESDNLPDRDALKEVIAHAASCVDESFETADDDDVPAIDLTVGWNEKTGRWGYQTGDNSYTGGAYGYPHWAVVWVPKDPDEKTVDSLVGEIRDQLWDLVSY